MDKLFPTIQGIMCLCAGIVYGYRGDLGRCIYWLAACILTGSITYLIK